MLLNESPDNGAYPRKAFTPLTTNNKAVLKALIKGLAIGDDKGSNADFAKAMYEAYLYFKGLAPYQGAARAQARHRTRSAAAATTALPARRARATT